MNIIGEVKQVFDNQGKQTILIENKGTEKKIKKDTKYRIKLEKIREDNEDKEVKDGASNL